VMHAATRLGSGGTQGAIGCNGCAEALISAAQSHGTKALPTERSQTQRANIHSSFPTESCEGELRDVDCSAALAQRGGGARVPPPLMMPQATRGRPQAKKEGRKGGGRWALPAGAAGALPTVKPLFTKRPPAALPCATKRSPLCKSPWPELFALPGTEPPSLPCLRRGMPLVAPKSSKRGSPAALPAAPAGSPAAEPAAKMEPPAGA
jgi:hypothetical protein